MLHASTIGAPTVLLATRQPTISAAFLQRCHGVKNEKKNDVQIEKCMLRDGVFVQRNPL